MTTHELKCWTEYFGPVAAGVKAAELRRDDRGYRVGDTLVLREWEPTLNSYSGRTVTRQISHIVRGGEWLTPGYVMLSLEAERDAAVARVERMQRVVDAAKAWSDAGVHPAEAERASWALSDAVAALRAQEAEL